MGIVGAQQRLAVERHLGIGVQAVEAQLGMGLCQAGSVHIETGAVLPVGQTDPLQLGFGRTDVGIADQLMRQQIGVHAAWHRGRPPLLQARMGRALRVAGQQPELPLRLQRCGACREGAKGDHQQQQTDSVENAMHVILLFFRRA